MFIPRSIRLADPAYNSPGKIDILIGAGPYWEILIGTPRNRINGQPALQNTKLGWILGGNLSSKGYKSTDQALTCLTITNEQLHQQLEQFWKVENLPGVRYFIIEEKACEKQFVETTHRDKDGRFVVRLPTKANVELGESREQAQRRLEALERRFKRHPDLAKAYCTFMDEYEQSGHMTLISDTEALQGKEVYFIPHQSVIRPDSLTTKLRVVFDASAKTTSGTSLDDKLMSGSNLQRDLFKILLRFRTYQYVVTADIAQMFRQIFVDT